MNGITLKVESWAEFYPDCLPLLGAHHEEIGEIDDSMPLDPDVVTCEQMDYLGLMQILVARREYEMVGYCIFTIGNSLCSKNVLCGTQNLFFVSKDERAGSGVGALLYKKSLELLKERGVKRVYPHHWLRGDSYKLKPFFERLGAVEIEHVYSINLGD